MSTAATAVSASAPAPAPASAPSSPAMLAKQNPQSEEIEVAAESCNNAPRPLDDSKSTYLHSPPDSNNAMKLDGSDDSELSDVEDPTIDPTTTTTTTTADHLSSQPQAHGEDELKQPKEEQDEEDIGEVLPDHWSGTVPVFKPNMDQFRDFKKFMTKVDSYGMKSGIIKIIPPQEWKDALPNLDDLVKQVRVREPIKQDIMGSNGTYRQVNILHQRSYNLPQWRQLCDQSEHQPPARRGERRAQAPPKPKQASGSTSTLNSTTVGGKRRGRPTRNTRSRRSAAKDNAADPDERPMTPVSPKPTEDVVESVEQDPGADIDDDDDFTPLPGRMGGLRQSKPKTQSTSARRKYAKREGSARIDEEAFRDWDYHMDISDYTPERCEELERIYWKTLTYAQPLYGADLPGTLFDDRTEAWNLNKLPNLLDVLGTKVPGVNTAYLYLGMWKATFAWHLEDVDLYSINFLHFGAPKQWYSISQGDARRFEAAMKSIWPTDAKACDQFLRHKAFLISPNHLQQYFNIKVNKCVSYPGEFVVTYPYGYHSGYNLGYNCAEAVNFALDSWLPMGKIAKRCECAQAQDSVWIDVYEIERKLRGEDTDYYDSEDDEEEEEEEDDDLDTGMPTPRSSHAVKFKSVRRKRKRAVSDKGEKKAKKIRLRVKNTVEPPCCLCPHDIPGQELLQTDGGRRAHRICALYGPETWIETVDDEEIVANADNISKARMDLKCLYCRSKKGACFQCSQKKCARSYHATCAAAAGVLVEEAEVPIFGEDGTEYKEQAFEFSCRFHRTKRDKKLDGEALDECQKTRKAAASLEKGDICQLQYYRGDIFAGTIVENRADEQTFLVDVVPNGDRVEVEWKWLLLPDPADLHLPKASPNAIPMPTSRKAKEKINATKRQVEELPRPESPFVDGGFTWAEFNHYDDCTNKEQAKIDFSKDNQLWYYLAKGSTDARPHYTENPRLPRHNPRSNFLDTIPKPAPAPKTVHPRTTSYGSSIRQNNPTPNVFRPEKPYQYKPRVPVLPPSRPSNSTPFVAHQFTPKVSPSYTAQQFLPKQYYPYASSHQAVPQSPSPYTFKGGVQKIDTCSLQTVAPLPSPRATVATPFTAHSNIQPPPAGPTISSTPQSAIPKPPSATAQQNSAPRPASASRRPSMQSSRGHVRNRSSINSQSSQGLSFGSSKRFGTPPLSYGNAHSSTKSPFSHGFTQPPGLGPSPSPQNGQFFQAQARARSNSTASNRSLHTPMTSSVIRPSASASAQALAGQLQSAILASNNKKEEQSSIIQKYAFFQVHNNRDSTKYRTPYAHWGGFTNGYEGDLRGHLMKTPDALFRVGRRYSGHDGSSSDFHSATHLPPIDDFPARNSSANAVSQSAVDGSASDSRVAMPTSSPAFQYTYDVAQASTASPSHQSTQTHGELVNRNNSWLGYQAVGGQLHPAIRAQYAAMIRNSIINSHDPSHEAPTLEDGECQFSSNPMAAIPKTTPIAPSLIIPPTDRTAQGKPLPTPSPLVSMPPSAFSTTPYVGSMTETAAKAPSKAPLIPPKQQTYIPPPRPWEMLRKMQSPTQQPVHQASIPPSNTQTAPMADITMTSSPDLQNSPAVNGFDPSKQTPDMGMQYDNYQHAHAQPVSAQWSYGDSIQTPQSTVVTPEYTPAPPHTWTDTQPQSPPSNPVHPYPLAVSEPQCGYIPAPALRSATGESFPEVPAESMDLVESIVRNAQRASGSYFS